MWSVLLIVASTAPASDAVVYRSLAEKVAREERVEPRLLLAIVEIESGFDHRKRGKDGEIGMAQVMPFWSDVFEIPVHWLYDAENNLRASARILKRCRARWRPHYTELDEVNRRLARLDAPFGPATFTATCYNWGRIALELRRTPRRRWRDIRIPASTVRYATRFQRAYLRRAP